MSSFLLFLNLTAEEAKDVPYIGKIFEVNKNEDIDEKYTIS